ncbi:hypothetical protein WCLP8_1990003 [uncultured Gammaproteobacteria bacterium]
MRFRDGSCGQVVWAYRLVRFSPSWLKRRVALVFAVTLAGLLVLAAAPSWAADPHKPASATTSGGAADSHGARSGEQHKAHGGQPAGAHGGHGGEAEEAAPETFIVLDLLSEAAEASVAGIGVKIAELSPKIKHINELYRQGEDTKANAKLLGIMTEVILIGALIEVTGVGELFLTAISFAGGWAYQLVQSTAGILAITKTAVFAGETVEEAAEEKFVHAAAAAKAAAAAAKAKKRK